MNQPTDEQRKAALEAGKRGVKAAYEKSKAMNLKWWERLMWVILAGMAYAACSLLTGCGHSVDITQEQTKICKDGSCLVIRPDCLSYSQAQPQTDVKPVVRKGK